MTNTPTPPAGEPNPESPGASNEAAQLRDNLTNISLLHRTMEQWAETRDKLDPELFPYYDVASPAGLINEGDNLGTFFELKRTVNDMPVSVIFRVYSDRIGVLNDPAVARERSEEDRSHGLEVAGIMVRIADPIDNVNIYAYTDGHLEDDPGDATGVKTEPDERLFVVAEQLGLKLKYDASKERINLSLSDFGVFTAKVQEIAPQEAHGEEFAL